jgi:hypothetical protein
VSRDLGLLEFVGFPTCKRTAAGRLDETVHAVAHRRTVYMVLAYGKDMKDDLTEGERAELKCLARMTKEGQD